MNKRKLNIIDVIIIVLIIAVVCIGGYIYVSSTPETIAADTETFEFTVMITDLPQEPANSFKAGDNVTFGESTSGSGVIENVEVVPYKKLSENKDDGTYIWSEVPDKYTAYVTIKTDVKRTDYDFTSGSESIAIGKKMPINAVGAASENGFVVNLKEAE